MNKSEGTTLKKIHSDISYSSENSSLRLKRRGSSKSTYKPREVDLSFHDGFSDNTLVIGDLLRSEEFGNQLLGLKTLRKLLVKYTDEKHQNTAFGVIDGVIENNLLPDIVRYLEEPKQALQEEAAWIVTNLATGETRQVRYLVEAGAVQALVCQMATGPDSLREKAAWGLGNIAGDCSDFRDFTLDVGIADAVFDVLSNPIDNLPLLYTTSWLLSILCKEVSDTHYKKLVPTVPQLRNLLKHHDPDLATQCCWCLASLSFGSKERIDVMLDHKVPAHLGPLFARGNHILVPTLLIIGNVASGNEDQTQPLFDLGLIDQVSRLLNSSEADILRSACWILSNVSAGSEKHIQLVLSLGVIPILLSILRKGAVKTAREVAWTLRNISRSGSVDQVLFLSDMGVVEEVCAVLLSNDHETVRVALGTLDAMLHVGELEYTSKGITNPISILIQKCNGIENLETLLSHQSVEVYRKTFDILEKYFNG